MAQMMRKQVHIGAQQDVVLKQHARMLGVPEAEVLRRAIDRLTALLLASGILDPKAWERERDFIAGGMAGGPPWAPGSDE